MAEGNLFDKVLGWLRAGYPQGVPQQDYVALFGLLRRSLTTAEVEQIAETLRQDNPTTSGISDEQIRDLISDTTLQTPSEDDVRRVQAHLAMGGWPLAEDLRRQERADGGEEPGAVGEPNQADRANQPDRANQADQPSDPAEPRQPGRMQRMLNWLRAGYPQGIPSDDFVPLVALLGRRLGEDELHELGDSLRDSGMLPPDHTDIGQAYLGVTGELASPEQLERVADRLRRAGWEVEPSAQTD